MSAWTMFVGHPWAALVPAMVFLVIWMVRFRRPGSTVMKAVGAIPAVAWLLYAVYEWRMLLWSETVIAPIRVDLLLVIPALAILSTIGLMALVQRPPDSTTAS